MEPHESVRARVSAVGQVLHSAASVRMMKERPTGIGQLLRSLNIAPTFELLAAGRTEVVPSNERGQGSRKGLWRLYDMRSPHLSCRIHEQFSPDVLSLDAHARENEATSHPCGNVEMGEKM